MTKEASEVLTREAALKNMMSPMGRKYGAVKDVRNPSLCKIGRVDGRPGDIPRELEGNFTRVGLAEDTLQAFLKKQWDMSDEVRNKGK